MYCVYLSSLTFQFKLDKPNDSQTVYPTSVERGRLSPLSSTFLNFFDQCESSMRSGLLIGLGLMTYLLLIMSATTLVVQPTRSVIPGMQQGTSVSLAHGQ